MIRQLSSISIRDFLLLATSMLLWYWACPMEIKWRTHSNLVGSLGKILSIFSVSIATLTHSLTHSCTHLIISSYFILAHFYMHAQKRQFRCILISGSWHWARVWYVLIICTWFNLLTSPHSYRKIPWLPRGCVFGSVAMHSGQCWLSINLTKCFSLFHFCQSIYRPSPLN